MKEYTVVSCTVQDRPKGPVCSVIRIDENGEKSAHIFPIEALEWRAAEYDINPNDIDTLLDIVFHEAFVPDPLEPKNISKDAAVQRGLVTKVPGPIEDYEPTTLFMSEDVAEARQAHLVRIEDAKATRGKVHFPQKGSEDPLQIVRDTYTQFVDQGQINQKQRYLEQHRKIVRTKRQKKTQARTLLASQGKYERQPFVNPHDRKERGDGAANPGGVL